LVAKEEARRFRSMGLLRAWKRGAEGQSRTDTGSPIPVFECGATVRVRRQSRRIATTYRQGRIWPKTRGPQVEIK